MKSELDQAYITMFYKKMNTFNISEILNDRKYIKL